MSGYKQARKNEQEERGFGCFECCHKEPHKPCEDHHHKPCEDHHKPEHHKCPEECHKQSAQFVNDNKQELEGKGPKVLKFTEVPVLDGCDIKLIGLESIFLVPGRYLVSYFLELKNEKHNDDVKVTATLVLNGVPLAYTSGTELLGERDDDDDDQDTLSKTNLIDVFKPSQLKLVVTSDEYNAHVEIKHVSLVVLAV